MGYANERPVAALLGTSAALEAKPPRHRLSPSTSTRSTGGPLTYRVGRAPPVDILTPLSSYAMLAAGRSIQEYSGVR